MQKSVKTLKTDNEEDKMENYAFISLTKRLSPKKILLTSGSSPNLNRNLKLILLGSTKGHELAIFFTKRLETCFTS